MIIDLGFCDYEKSYRTQKELLASRAIGEIEDSLVLVEHPAIFTIGRRGDNRNLLTARATLDEMGLKVVRVDRGGDITFHGPGQLVCYPIVDLKNRGRDLHVYLRDLEGVVIRTLAMYGIVGSRINGLTGVWANTDKICSIGIGASNWITYHGFSLNVSIDLSYFGMINPCGNDRVRMTSMKEILGKEVSMTVLKDNMIRNIRNIFKIQSGEYGRFERAIAS